MPIITFYSFLESFVYLCDFHREQSWDRWLSATHNGMNTKKSDVLLLLRPLAQALSDDDFNEALNLLQVRNLKYWVIWHIADILITIPLNQNILIISCKTVQPIELNLILWKRRFKFTCKWSWSSIVRDYLGGLKGGD